MKRTYILLGLVVLIAIWLIAQPNSNDQEIARTTPLRVGAILPLSGGAAIWGEQFQRGTELALEDLSDDISIEIVYEDSQANAAQGVSAFHRLTSVDNVDVVMSGLSRVSIPLTTLALDSETPLIMSLVQSNSAVSSENPYAFRIFHNANQAGRLFSPIFMSQGYKKIGLLHLNDEYGSSVAEAIKEAARGHDIAIISDSYISGDSDFRTQIIKIKESHPQAVVFIGIPPNSLANFITQAKDLELGVPVFEPAGILTNQGGRGVVGENSEGVYTMATPFDVHERGANIHSRYTAEFGAEAGHAVSYGYDFVMLVAEAIRDGFTDRTSFLKNLRAMDRFEGITSSYSFDNIGNITPTIYPAQIINGELTKISE